MNRRMIVAVLIVLLTLTACRKADTIESTNTSSTERTTTVSETHKPSLLWISIDTWRWDYIGVSGQGKVRTSTLDMLAGEGVYEPEAVSPCPLTTPSHASMFTGQVVMNHGVFDCVNYSLDGGKTTVAANFQKSGYRTAGFVSAETMMKRFGLDNGFQRYDDSGIAKFGKNEWLSANKDGKLTTDAVLAFLTTERSGTELFLFVHYFDLHVPYRPRPDYDRMYPDNPYAAQVAFVDDEIERLLGYIQADSSRQWRIVIVGDHGEGHGDHDEVGHGYGLYRSTRHVPLIIWPKPERELTLPKPWGLIDLAPTLLDWFSLPAMSGSDGVSLFTDDQSVRDLPCMTILSTLMFSVNPNVGIRRQHYMYMRHGEEELYDLSQDPAERINLIQAGDYSDVREQLRTACDTAFPLETIMEQVSPTLNASRDELQRLQSLGYMTGTLPTHDQLQKADIRQVIVDHNNLTQAQTDYSQQGDLAGLVRAFRLFLEKYPRAISVHRNFSKILLKEGRFEEALPVLEKVIELDDRDATSLTNLGTLLLKRGEITRARDLLEKAIAADDSYPLAHKNLAVLYTDFDVNPRKAVVHYKKFLALVPQSPEADRIQAYINSQDIGQASP